MTQQTHVVTLIDILRQKKNMDFHYLIKLDYNHILKGINPHNGIYDFFREIDSLLIKHGMSPDPWEVQCIGEIFKMNTKYYRCYNGYVSLRFTNKDSFAMDIL